MRWPVSATCQAWRSTRIEKFELPPLTRRAESHASLECRLADCSLIAKYNYFNFEVV
jgi:hypothetical protein